MDEIISYKMYAVKVRNAKLRNYLNLSKRRFCQYGRHLKIAVTNFTAFCIIALV